MTIRILGTIALGVAIASMGLSAHAQGNNPTDTRHCPEGMTTMPDGTVCPPISEGQDNGAGTNNAGSVQGGNSGSNGGNNNGGGGNGGGGNGGGGNGGGGNGGGGNGGGGNGGG